MSLEVNFKHSQYVLEQPKATAAKNQVGSRAARREAKSASQLQGHRGVGEAGHSSGRWIPPEKLFHSQGNCQPRFTARRCRFNHHGKVVNCAKHVGYNIKPFASHVVAARSPGSPWSCPGDSTARPGVGDECLQGDVLLGSEQEP